MRVIKNGLVENFRLKTRRLKKQETLVEAISFFLTKVNLAENPAVLSKKTGRSRKRWSTLKTHQRNQALRTSKCALGSANYIAQPEQRINNF